MKDTTTLRLLKTLAIAGAAGVGIYLLSSETGVIGAQPEAWKSVHGLPLPLGWDVTKYKARVSAVKPYGDAPPDLIAVYAHFQNQWAMRRKLLPPDAKPYQDGYSTEHFLVMIPPPWPMGGPFASAAANVDQWGRVAVAEKGTGGGDPLGAVLTVAGYALPYVPGIGPEASAALATAIALGKGQSLKDAALAGLKAGLPAPAQVAFDLGVGVVVEKKSISEATKSALLQQIPGGQKAYDLGVAQAKRAGLG